MTLGKVTGTIVATQKDEKLVGSKLMVVQDVDLNGEVDRKYTVAVDAVGAGIGEIVLVATGSSARQDGDDGQQTRRCCNHGNR